MFSLLQSIIFNLKLNKEIKVLLELTKSIGITDQLEEILNYTVYDENYRVYKYIHSFNVPIPTTTFAVDARLWGVGNSYDAMLLYEQFLSGRESPDRYDNWKYWHRFKRKVKPVIKPLAEIAEQITRTINRLLIRVFVQSLKGQILKTSK